MQLYHEAVESLAVLAKRLVPKMITAMADSGAVDTHDMDLAQMGRAFHDTMVEIAPFYWSAEILSQVTKRPVIAGAPTVAPCEAGWYFFDRPIAILPNRFVKAILWYRDSPEATMPITVGATLEEGAPYSQAWLDLMKAARGFVDLSFAWLQTTVTTEAHPIERHALKRLRKAGSLTAANIRVVVLRRAERKEPTGESMRVLHVQYMVRKHDRHLKDGRVIPVRAHRKGPLGAPFKMPTDQMFAVVR